MYRDVDSWLNRVVFRLIPILSYDNFYFIAVLDVFQDYIHSVCMYFIAMVPWPGICLQVSIPPLWTSALSISDKSRHQRAVFPWDMADFISTLGCFGPF